MFALVLLVGAVLLALAARAAVRVVRRAVTPPAVSTRGGSICSSLTIHPAGLPAGLAGGGG